LLFGRRTYDLMASYWPTPKAHQNDPAVIEQMNNLPKVLVNAIVLGRGLKLFDEVQQKMPLTLKSSRVFGNGNVLLSYTLAP
jgi:hypothetical protein